MLSDLCGGRNQESPTSLAPSEREVRRGPVYEALAGRRGRMQNQTPSTSSTPNSSATRSHFHRDRGAASSGSSGAASAPTADRVARSFRVAASQSVAVRSSPP